MTTLCARPAYGSTSMKRRCSILLKISLAVGSIWRAERVYDNAREIAPTMTVRVDAADRDDPQAMSLSDSSPRRKQALGRPDARAFTSRRPRLLAGQCFQNEIDENPDP